MATFKMVNGRRVQLTAAEEAELRAFQASQSPHVAKDRVEAIVEFLIANIPAVTPFATELRDKVRGK